MCASYTSVAVVGADTPIRAQRTLWLSLALIAVWVALGASVNTAQWGDHFEQFVWAHSFEWGYHKHPPLPTWLLAGAIALIGPSPYWTYALAGLCTAGTALFTYGISLRLIGTRLTALAMLLWGLQQAFSERAQLFNHNTVMMLAVSGTVWCVLRAIDGRQRAWWIASGAGAGLAMLSKYQSVVPLAGIVVALLLSGELKSRTTRVGLALAAGVAALVFAPHLAWMQQHDFTTLRYAAQEGRPMPWSDRGLHVAGFLLQQLRLLFPALLFALLLWLWPGLRVRHEEPGIDGQRRQCRAWCVGLILFPLTITLLTCPAFGLHLQNHWGYQCLQFVSLWLAWRLRVAQLRDTRVIVTTALLVHALSLAVAAKPSWTSESAPGRRVDGQYPARELAAAVQADWHSLTACPLEIVVGPTFEAGMVSVYAARPPKVLEGGDFRKSPWIQPDELRRYGAVYVATDPGDLPQHGALYDLMRVHAGSAQRIYWTVMPPICALAHSPS